VGKGDEESWFIGRRRANRGFDFGERTRTGSLLDYKASLGEERPAVGSVNVKVLPSSGVESTQMRPPWALFAFNLDELVEDLGLVLVRDARSLVRHRDVDRFSNGIGLNLHVIPRVGVPEGV
jgi:hypothetical protein